MELNDIRIAKTTNSLLQEQVFEYDLSIDHVKLVRFVNMDSVEHVEIPEEIDGRPVTVIGKDCFFDCEKMKSVKIPDTVKRINGQAFAMCKKLSEIVIPDSVTTIGQYAFRDCVSLKKIIMPKYLKILPRGIFSFCNLEGAQVSLPERLEVIEGGAFWGSGYCEIEIPESVTSIGVGAFHDGPNPITDLPVDNGWFSQWPYGEEVESDFIESDGSDRLGGAIGSAIFDLVTGIDTVNGVAHSTVTGRITGLQELQGGCCIHEVTFEHGTNQFFFPCDYLDGSVMFKTAVQRESMNRMVSETWKTDAELQKAYALRAKWRAGLV